MPANEEFYDIVIVGAGHAGCEAALAAARLHGAIRKTYLADIVNPLEATGLSAKESTGSKKICRNTLPETSCTQCSMASECMYRHPNFNHSEGDNKCVKIYWND